MITTHKYTFVDFMCDVRSLEFEMCRFGVQKLVLLLWLMNGVGCLTY